MVRRGKGKDTMDVSEEAAKPKTARRGRGKKGKKAAQAQKVDSVAPPKADEKAKSKLVGLGLAESVSTANSMRHKKRVRQRTLVFGTRGVTAKHRHLMMNLRRLLPHAKSDAKLDEKKHLSMVNEVCEMKNCNNCLLFEARKRDDLYLWLAKPPSGPSVKFHVTNVHTMEELNMTGNCLLGSRAFLIFDKNFESAPELKVVKELFSQALGVPRGHPRSKPFFDHCMSFTFADGRIWFRHYQIVEEHKKGGKRTETEVSLVEIGPRFVLRIIRIFDGSFGGKTLYENENYISPNLLRAGRKIASAVTTQQRKTSVARREKRHAAQPDSHDPLDDVFREGAI